MEREHWRPSVEATATRCMQAVDKWIHIGLAPLLYAHTLKTLGYGSHNFSRELHHTCLYRVSVNHMAPPLIEVADIHLKLTTYLWTPDRRKGWVDLVGWPIANGLPTQVVSRQLQVESRRGKVRRLWSFVSTQQGGRDISAEMTAASLSRSDVVIITCYHVVTRSDRYDNH